MRGKPMKDYKEYRNIIIFLSVCIAVSVVFGVTMWQMYRFKPTEVVEFSPTYNIKNIQGAIEVCEANNMILSSYDNDWETWDRVSISCERESRQ